MSHPVPEASGVLSRYLEDAIRYIEAHYGEELSAASVAKELFILESNLTKRFRKELNTSFSEYLNYTRIRKAMLLLKQPEAKVYEVAEKTGFSDPTYFATMFRKFVGISPSQYKNSAKG